jgi:hypothetical protein
VLSAQLDDTVEPESSARCLSLLNFFNARHAVTHQRQLSVPRLTVLLLQPLGNT